MSKESDQYSKAETAKRLEAILRGAFSGSPKPMKDIPKKRASKPKTGKKVTGPKRA